MSILIYKKFITSIALLAMSLSFLAQITPLWIKKIDGTPIVICTAFGYQTIMIDENGNKIPAQSSMIKNNCAMCLNAGTYANIPYTKLAGDIIPYQKTAKINWNNKTRLSLPKPKNLSSAIRAPPSIS